MELVARFAHAAFEQVARVQLLADDTQVLVLALEEEARRASRYAQLGDLRKLIQDLLGQAVREIFLLLASDDRLTKGKTATDFSYSALGAELAAPVDAAGT